MKPGHILTTHPTIYASAIRRARPLVVTAGPEPPPDAKYIFGPCRSDADLVGLARDLRDSGADVMTTPAGTVRRAAPRPAPADPRTSAEPLPPAHPRIRVTASGPGPSVAVAVQCHADYLHLLPACIAAVEAQTVPPVERYLMLDRCTLPEDATIPPGWIVMHRDDGSPNPGRNQALHVTRCEWIWHVDADDPHPPDYLAGAVQRLADPRVGIVHADLAYSDGRIRRHPEYDYWGLRLDNYVDTSSLWRVSALRAAGGWADTDRWDDWDCALRVTALGWRTAKNPVPATSTVHPDGSGRNASGGSDFAHKWNRSYAIVSLLAGRDRDTWAEWREAVYYQEMPARTHLYLLVNAPDNDNLPGLRHVAASLFEKGAAVTILADRTPCPRRDKWSRHRHVANLYNRILPMVHEDQIIFWEDDVIPPTIRALRDLVDHWDLVHAGGICAMYPARNHPSLVCGSPSMDYWHMMRSLDQCRGSIQRGWGFLPGGFALHHTAIIKRSIPFAVSFPDGKMQGWDGQLSRAVRAAGRRLDLDGLIECQHRTGKTTES